MGQVIATFPREVLTQWSLNVVQSRATLRKLREFLANYEELIINGWLGGASGGIPQQIPAKPSTSTVEKKTEPEANAPKSYEDWAKTGAIPKGFVAQPASNNPALVQRQESLPTYSGYPTFRIMHSGASMRGFPGAALRKDTTLKKEKVVNNGKGNRKNQMPKSDVELAMCLGCNGAHKLYRCPDFLKKNVTERIQWVNERKFCQLCLANFHNILDCKKDRCRACALAHNSVLCSVSEAKRLQYNTTPENN